MYSSITFINHLLLLHCQYLSLNQGLKCNESYSELNSSSFKYTNHPVALLKRCKQCSMYDFSHNNFTVLAKDWFKAVIFVIEIYLNHNQLETVDRNDFYNLIVLNLLDLSYNKIRFFDHYVLSDKPNFNFLNLIGNRELELKFTSLDFYSGDDFSRPDCLWGIALEYTPCEITFRDRFMKCKEIIGVTCGRNITEGLVTEDFSQYRNSTEFYAYLNSGNFKRTLTRLNFFYKY